MEYKGIFETDLIDRTLEIINEYSGDKKDTLFLNCCTGLLVIPKQQLHNALPTDEISETEWGIDPALIKIETDKSVKKVATHIRNAISHDGFAFYSDDGKNITNVRLTDWKDPYHTSANKSFELALSITAFKKFILRFAKFAKDNRDQFI